MKVHAISSRVKRDLAAAEDALDKIVISGNPQLAEAAAVTLRAGGKRLRPALVLISGMVGKYDLENLLPAALGVELVHMASLVHDDVVDGAMTRRGFVTVNFIRGTKTATATGDFLFATAFVYLSQYNNPRVINIMAETSLALSLGELQQMETVYTVDQTLESYLARIRSKTAALFSACCQLGGLVCEAKESDIEALRVYGENLGMAFQIYDDVLDFSGQEESLGKVIGTDLRDGVVTMPILFALEESSLSSELRQVVENKKPTGDDIKKAINIVCQTQALGRACREAQHYVDVALEALQNISNERVRKDLEAVGHFVVERNC